jgi:hypothetical protein
MKMAQMLSDFKLVRIVPVGNGSKRITIPKEMLTEILGEDEYAAISKENGRLVIRPVEVKPKK